MSLFGVFYACLESFVHFNPLVLLACRSNMTEFFFFFLFQ